MCVHKNDAWIIKLPPLQPHKLPSHLMLWINFQVVPPSPYIVWAECETRPRVHFSASHHLSINLEGLNSPIQEEWVEKAASPITPPLSLFVAFKIRQWRLQKRRQGQENHLGRGEFSPLLCVRGRNVTAAAASHNFPPPLAFRKLSHYIYLWRNKVRKTHPRFPPRCPRRTSSGGRSWSTWARTARSWPSSWPS